MAWSGCDRDICAIIYRQYRIIHGKRLTHRLAGLTPASQQSWHARLVASRARLAFGAPHFRLRSNVAPRAKTQSSDERCAPSALQKCSIMTGCGARIVLRSACTLRPLPLLRFAASAAGGAHLRSTKYYLRFLLSIRRTSLAVSVRRIVRYCLRRKNG